MPKISKIAKRGNKRTASRKRKGGVVDNAGSAWNSVGETVGNGNQQWDNVFVRGGPFGNQVQNLDGSQPSVVPNNLTPMNGGKRNKSKKNRSSRKNRSSKRGKKGGFWGQVINQALVPFGLLAAQQRYGKRTRKQHK